MFDSIKIGCLGCLGFLCLVMVMSCQSQVEPRNQQVTYFDMKDFIEKEITYFEKQNLSLKKIMQTSKTSDTLLINQPEWLSELQILSSCNINKPTLYGTYTVDTIGKTIHYISILKKNKVQSCLLTFEDADLKTIEKIEIVNQKENFINRSSETIVYFPKQSYSIEIKQNVISAKGSSFKLFGEIQSVNN